MDVAAWLKSLGLERYAPAFRDNDVDAEVLLRLTAEDLRELGVASIGHRRRLLDAIAALTEGAPKPAAMPAATVSAVAPAISAPVDAERRQLTVMFCDLVGSTALSARLDPEDRREVIGAYHRAVSETVGRFDGFVAKYMGDGVLIYFGYPRAHEDDAERAVRAGLGLIDAVGRLDVKSVKLQARTGIATGLVVVGDLIGSASCSSNEAVTIRPCTLVRTRAPIFRSLRRMVPHEAQRCGQSCGVPRFRRQRLHHRHRTLRRWQCCADLRNAVSVALAAVTRQSGEARHEQPKNPLWPLV
jgi:hypothetical protein